MGQLRGTTLDVDCYGEYRATRPHRSSRRPWLCGAGASIVASCRLGSGLVGWRSERGREPLRRAYRQNFTRHAALRNGSDGSADSFHPAAWCAWQRERERERERERGGVEFQFRFNAVWTQREIVKKNHTILDGPAERPARRHDVSDRTTGVSEPGRASTNHAIRVPSSGCSSCWCRRA